MRFLLIQDDAALRLGLARQLEADGHRVILHPFRLRSSRGAQDALIATQGVTMKSSISARLVAAAALATAALGVASAAHASGHVYFSVGVQAAPVYVEPAPVYVQPEPVYVQPRRVYVQPPPYVIAPEVYGRPYPSTYDSAYDEERAWRRAQWHRRHWGHYHRDWDQYPSRDRNWD